MDNYSVFLGGISLIEDEMAYLPPQLQDLDEYYMKDSNILLRLILLKSNLYRIGYLNRIRKKYLRIQKFVNVSEVSKNQ
jgi:hypothetical protein